MLPEVYDSLLRPWSPETPQSTWEHVFSPAWDVPDDRIGFAMTDGGRVVGMLGTIFSERSIGGRNEQFCNLHGWIVDPEYRSRSLTLMRPLLNLKGYTLTDFTSGTGVNAMMKRLGFTSIDTTATVLPTLLTRGRSPRATVDAMAGPPDQFADVLSPSDLRIYADHRELDCGHLLFRVDGSYCYLVYTRIDRHMMPYCLLHYISDRPLFAKHHATIRSHLMRAAGSRLVVVDTRIVRALNIPFSFRVGATEKLYRSTTVAPEEVDTLYSEMLFFRHTTLPGIRHQLRLAATRMVPAMFRDAARNGN